MPHFYLRRQKWLNYQKWHNYIFFFFSPVFFYLPPLSVLYYTASPPVYLDCYLVRKSLTTESMKTLVPALIASRLDYCNSVFLSAQCS